MIFDYLFKYILVGDTGVGKSCILSQFIEQKFKANHEITIGVEFGSKIVQVQDKQIKLQIWDTVNDFLNKAGQESFRSITRSYYRSAAGAILVYDVTNRKTFDHVSNWLKEIIQNGNQTVTVILVGNKQDLDTKRQVTTEEGQIFAEKNNLLFFETSAKTANNVQTVKQYLKILPKVFEESADNIYQKVLNKEIDIESDSSGIRVSGQSQLLQNPQTQQKSKILCCYQ